MPSNRTVRRYDHRLIHLVQDTRDLSIAVARGVPRSTAAGWLKRGLTPVVAAKDDSGSPAALEREVAKLKRRVRRLTAILRIVFALLEILQVDLGHAHLAPEDKRKLLRVVGRTRGVLRLRRVLGLFGLSASRFHSWRNEARICRLGEQAACPRASPQRLTPREVLTIVDMVTSTEYRHVPTGRLALLAQRMGVVFASASTWHKLIRQRGWRRPRIRVHPEQAKTGIRASRPDEVWHVDTTLIRLLDGSKVYLHAVIDDFSRRILAWKVATTFTMESTVAILLAAGGAQARRDPAAEPPTLLADAGVENVNHSVDRLVTSGVLRRLIAQTEVRFSNSMIEAWWRSLKHQWLYLNTLNNAQRVRELVAFYVAEHNSKLPHSAFRGQTPDEMYFGTGDAVPAELQAARTTARQARLDANKGQSCSACSPTTKGGPSAA